MAMRCMNKISHIRLNIVLLAVFLIPSAILFSQGWNRVYPDYPPNDLAAIIRWNGDTLFAGGTQWTLLRSIDGGNTWSNVFTRDPGMDIVRMETDGTEVYLLPSYSWQNRAAFDNPSSMFFYRYIPGTNDTIRITVPIVQRNGSGRGNYYDLSAGRGCIAMLQRTSQNVLLFSEDRCGTWQSVNLPDSLSVQNNYPMIYFFDRLKGVLLSGTKSSQDERYPFMTGDGGLTWNRVGGIRYAPMEYYQGFHKLPVQWISDSLLLLVNGNIPVLSRDAGMTWTEMASVPSTIISIGFSLSGTGFCVGSDQRVFKTIDWGRHWIMVKEGWQSLGIQSSAHLLVGPDRFLYGGLNGFLVRTADGGLTWDYTHFSGMYNLSRPYFFTPNRGALIAWNIRSDHQLYCRTSDGGRSWDAVCDLEGLGNPWIQHVSENTALAISVAQQNDTLVRVTSDGGYTWRAGYIRQPGDSVRWWIGGNWHHGEDTLFVQTNRGLLTSNDRGGSWSILPSTVSLGSELVAMDMRFRTLRLLFKDKLVASSDGGASWSTVFSAPDTLNTNTGLFGLNVWSEKDISIQAKTRSYEGIVMRSTDAGASWTVKKARNPAAYSMQFLFPSGIGYLPLGGMSLPYTEDALLGRTTDAFESNEISLSFRGAGTAPLLSSFYFLDEMNGWACGYNIIYRTSDGGLNWTSWAPAVKEPALLGDIYPHPASSGEEMNISYRISSSTGRHAMMEIFDLLGRKVETLLDAESEPGLHSIVWRSAGTPPGMYFVRLRQGTSIAVKKILIAR